LERFLRFQSYNFSCDKAIRTRFLAAFGCSQSFMSQPEFLYRPKSGVARGCAPSSLFLFFCRTFGAAEEEKRSFWSQSPKPRQGATAPLHSRQIHVQYGLLVFPKNSILLANLKAMLTLSLNPLNDEPENRVRQQYQNSG
jgi:hypothetical protein